MGSSPLPYIMLPVHPKSQIASVLMRRRIPAKTFSPLFALLTAFLLLPGFYNFGWGQTQTQTFTTSGSFTVPTGVTSITVQCWGGGGAGGGSNTNNSGGSGGGGGGYTTSLLSVTPGQVINFTVGAGGTGVTSGTGNNGTSTTFLMLTANGGTGGAANQGAYGIGGTATGGTTNTTGNNGSKGTTSGGAGGAGANGGAGGTGATNAKGGDGTAPGGGGGGGERSSNTSYAGGNGAAGQVIISWIPPGISVSPISLDFGFVSNGSTSANSTYTLSGNSLSPATGNITVAAPANFEVSTNSTTGFASSITVAYAGGSITGTTIYVRFKPTASNFNYSGNITNSLGGFTTQNIVVTGNSNLSYCSASGATCDEYISRVVIGSINNSSSCSSGYTDNASLVTDVMIGNNYSITVTNGNPYTYDQCGIWIDWNQDGDFGDANETISITGTPGGGPYSTSITPPTNALVGNTRIRVRIMYTGTMLSCGSSTYGEVEDYTLNVLPAVSIATGSITGSPFCAGAAVLVPFTITGTFTVGNIFTAQLSDASGSFASPVNIGTLTSTNAGTISATIPTSSANGTGYRIRVVSNIPTQTGIDNGSGLTIGLPSPPSIGTITQPTCALTTGSVVLSGLPTTGTWTINPGNISGTGTSKTVTNLSSGTYNFTVTNSAGCTSSASTNVVINSPTLPTIIGSSGSRCGPGTVSLGATASAGTINWYDAGGTFLNTGATYTTPNLSSTTTYFIDATSGSCTTPRTAVLAVIIPPASISVSGAGNICLGSTLNLTSIGAGITNQYWQGPNGFYSTNPNVVINNVAATDAGTYTVTGSALSGINLVANGDFELGNIGFGTSYTYVTPAANALYPEGDYTIVANPHSVHDGFDACANHTATGTLQMVVNGAAASKNIWTQTVNVVPNTDYQFTYWVQSVNPSSPSQSQLYVNDLPLGSSYTADATTCTWKQFVYNWSSGSNSTAKLDLRNLNLAAGGNDFAIDDIIFQQVCPAAASGVVTIVAPPTAGAIGNAQTICRGYTPTAISSTTAGTGVVSYEWQTNASGSYVTIPGEIGATYTPPALSATTSYQRRTIGTACNSAYTTPVSITVNGPTSSPGGPDLACQSASPTEIILSGATVSGGATTGAWSIISGGGTLSSIAQTATPATVTYTPAANYNGNVTLQLRTNVVSGQGNCDAIANRIITFRPTIAASISGSTTVCQNATTPVVTFNNPQAFPITIIYNINGINPATINVGASTTATVTAPTTTAGTFAYNLVSVAYQSGPSCSTNITGKATITVNPTLPVSVNIAASANPVCYNTLVIFTATPTNGGATPAYQWKVNGANVGTNSPTYAYIPVTGDKITCVLTSNATLCTSGNPATSNTVSMTFSPAPTSGTLTPTPAIGAVCAGTIVSATATSGSDGAGVITDILQYRYDGGTWVAYSSGTSLNTTGHTSVDIQTYRTATGSGCPTSATATVSWTINAIPASGTLTPNFAAGAVCAGTTLLATATAGTGGAGTITDVLQYRFDGGGWLPYISGSYLSTMGHTSVDIQTYRTATGSNCTTSTPNIISWTVNALPPVPAAITGTGSVCVGSTTQLADVTAGGVWTSASTGVATISTNGLVTGVTAGTSIITYTITNANGCKSTATQTVTVNALPPAPAAITGTVAICIGSTTQLSDATSGGVWTSASTGVATISAMGLVTGVSAGTSVITYTVSVGSCINSATIIVTVTPTVGTPTTPTPSASTICQGSANTTYTTSATNATSYVWKVTGTGNTISGTGTTGTVTWAAGFSGQATVSVTATGCGTSSAASTTVNVTPNASIASVTGSSSICIKGTTTYTANSFVLSGGTGTWSSSNTAIATVTPVTGGTVVTGVTAGTCDIIYTITGGCGGTVFAKQSVTIIGDQVWTGTLSTDWNNPGNWSCNFVPDLTTNVLIPNVTNQPILDTGIIGTAKDITIATGSSLTVTGNTLQIAGAITNSGTFTATAGTIEMKGTASQTVGAVFSGNTIGNLTINNSAGVTLSGALNVTGIVLARTGNLNSGGNLTLLSTAAQTALIDGTGMGNVLGNVTMQRYLPSAFGYKYFSSPFSDATVAAFSTYLSTTATIPTFYAYDEENRRDSTGVWAYQSGWVKYLAGTLSPMYGYAANFGSNTPAKTVSISGSVSNGSMFLSLYNHNRKYTKGFNLAGNPFPSPIDWDIAGWTKTNIDNALYFFNAGNTDQYTGSYSSYVNGVKTGNADNNIASMQGFFVHVTDGIYPISGTLGFTNSVRTNNLNPLFKAAIIDDRTILRFAANFETKNAIEDAAVIYFDGNANLRFEQDMDALKMINTDVLIPNVYTLSTDIKQLSINGMPSPTDSITKIPLGITTMSDGWINFKAKDIRKLPSSTHIYLIDVIGNITQDLKLNSTYRFFLKTGEYNQRFTLVFSLSDINKPAAIVEKMFTITRSGDHLYAKVNLPLNTKGDLSVTNMQGQTLLRKGVFEMETVEINPNSGSGVYIVTMVSGKRTESEKILIRKDYE